MPHRLLLLLLFFPPARIALANEPPTLRQLAEQNQLVVGAMLIDATWDTPRQKELVAAEFNAGTVGAFWKRTRPSRVEFNWELTDRVALWARSEGLKIHLHPLLYPGDEHNPAWVLSSNPADARAILREHVTHAARRYRGVADVWDVVNEAVAPSRWGGYRDCWWLRAMGPGYITEAFRLARAADPDATLLYNETGIENGDWYETGKWRTTQKILRTLHAEKLIDGVGWQVHTTPDEALGRRFALAERMKWVRDELGLMNFVTELDVAIGPGADELDRQRQAYQRVTEIWREHAAGGWLQTWGVYDKHTWLGSDKRPLLFDENYQRKPAWLGVREGMLKPIR